MCPGANQPQAAQQKRQSLLLLLLLPALVSLRHWCCRVPCGLAHCMMQVILVHACLLVLSNVMRCCCLVVGCSTDRGTLAAGQVTAALQSS
jgi:hypothetical protein